MDDNKAIIDSLKKKVSRIIEDNRRKYGSSADESKRSKRRPV